MYDAPKNEKKWQEIWEKKGLYDTDLKGKKGKPYYNLVMFPYPSGDKLHIGHWYNFAPADSWGRFMRMHGHNVFTPMGFDAFGLPAENYAVKTGTPPDTSTAKNVKTMIRQLKELGAMYDWSQTVNTSDPDYYKWTQWLFLEMYKRGLAYKKKSPVNWCTGCKTVLANEQAQEGICERCNNPITKKHLAQWFWKITDYAEKLLNYDGLDWPQKTKTMQENWIGRSEGVNFHCKIKGTDYEFDVFDSVPQTHMAQTFAVIAPEHSVLMKLVKGTKYEKKVKECVDRIKKKKLTKKYNFDEDMDGCFTGLYIEDPYGTGDLPLWVASFAIVDYGSGIVNCSAHDERDFIFAKKYKIPLRPVMFPPDKKLAKEVRDLKLCYHHADEGILEQPMKFKGRQWGEVRGDIIDYLEKEKKIGTRHVNYRLRDWLISRQRYWGAPIPIINCEDCGEVPVPEKDLPVKLPRIKEYKPKGKAPLATSSSFMNTKCPKCGGKATREPDTMDTFVCSSWYFLRYPCANLKSKPFDKEVLKQWSPVDMYIGGPEHACMHLLYARFVNHVLYDAKLITSKEPFKRLIHQGMVTKDGAKMSKSKGNVVSPDAFVQKYGSDIFRMYMMFMGPFTQGGDWNDQGITGVARFVQKIWKLITGPSLSKMSPDMTGMLHRTIKKVTGDIERLHFNTALAACMEFMNAALKEGIDDKSKDVMVRLIAPMAPHLSEELWAELNGLTPGGRGWTSVFDADWPKYSEKLAAEEMIQLVVQVNGKVRATVEAASNISQEDALKLAYMQDNVQRYLEGKKVVKEIFVPGKLVSFVVK